LPTRAASAARDPGLFLAGLGQDAPALDGETGWAAYEYHQNPLGRHTCNLGT
jgi:hypothetical protein